MGWTFRRSVKMGPLRVNLSTSGPGASVSVRGARVAVGPRGTYVTFGGSGFHYRRKLTHTAPPPQLEAVETGGSIRTASASELAVSSPEWMVSDALARLTSWHWFKAYGWGAALVLLWIWASSPGWVLAVAVLFAIGFGIPIERWDRERRTARIIYDVDDPQIVQRLEMANGAAKWLASCSSLWHIFHSVSTTDWKKNAGAGTLIRRTPTRCAVGALPGFELNIEVWCVPVGPQQLLFLPDRLLVWDGTALAALPYESITARMSATRFIEDGGRLPRDGQQVDSTWRFVRRDGGPDLRFGNNAQLPIMRYGELDLTSAGGLRVVLQTSTPDAASGAERALTALSRVGTWGLGQAREAASPRMARTAAEPVTPTRPSTSTVPPSVDPGQVAIASSVATLLRYLAGADRRIDAEEVAFAEGLLNRLLPSDHPELARLCSSFRSLPTDQESVAWALALLGNTEPGYRHWVIDSLGELTQADGRVTPKEVQRLREMRQALGI